MATSYAKRFLSGSTNGKFIKITGTATGSANTIHTVTSTSTDAEKDEVWLYAHNVGNIDIRLTIEFGSTSTDDNLLVSVPAAAGLTCIVPGLVLNNSLVIKAFTEAAGGATDIRVSGYVNRISET